MLSAFLFINCKNLQKNVKKPLRFLFSPLSNNVPTSFAGLALSSVYGEIKRQYFSNIDYITLLVKCQEISLKKMRKRKIKMFLIHKEEAEALRAKYPNAFITICSKRKNSGGKTYWCAENTEYHKFIDNLRKNKE